jgi:hypothetical protein
MIKLKEGICKRCAEETEKLGIEPVSKVLVRSSPPLCCYHNIEHKKGKLKLKPKRARKVTGELELFKEIWEERKHVSYVSGVELGEFNVCFFAHILSKGAYPRYRLRKDNIILLTFDEHQLLDFASHKINGDPNWDEVMYLKEKLKKEYNSYNRVKVWESK